MLRVFLTLFGALTLGLPTVAMAQETGTLQQTVYGDIACYLTLTDADGKPFEVMADFDLCEQDDLIGRRVVLTFETLSVMAASCEGDPECQDTEEVPLATAMRAKNP
ncbi:MAG: hypothetical protein ACPGOY_05290 [Rhodospirillaceae bacterium]